MTEKKKPEPAPEPAKEQAPETVSLKHPATGEMHDVTLPKIGNRKEGDEFNATVRNPKTRVSFSHRFKVVKGKAQPLT